MWSESNRDNLSVVAAGCTFFALFAIFPALSALISLYSLMRIPRPSSSNSACWVPCCIQAYNIVIEQIRRISAAPGGTLGLSLALSLGWLFGAPTPARKSWWPL